MTNMPTFLRDNFDACVQNIMNEFETATPEQIAEGISWYEVAKNTAKEIGLFFGRSEYEVATVIALLSPNQRWKTNIDATIKALVNFQKSDYKNVTFSRQTNKVYEFLHTKKDTIKGPKVRSFRNCILGDTEDVCVDLWALRIAINNPTFHKTFNETSYRLVQNMYQDAAKLTSFTPVELQAITWCSIRGTGK